MQESVALGALSFFVALVVLSFFSSILLNIVDATYLCYAIDKDTQTITKQDVHDVFSQVFDLFPILKTDLCVLLNILNLPYLSIYHWLLRKSIRTQNSHWRSHSSGLTTSTILKVDQILPGILYKTLAVWVTTCKVAFRMHPIWMDRYNLMRTVR